MTLKARGFSSGVLCVVLGVALSSQAPAPPTQSQPQRPTFTVQIDAVTMDVVVRDSDGRFVPNLKKEEFEIFEDGIRQDITSMTLSHGGRVTNVLEPPPAAAPEGIILPPKRVVNDTSGRIFLFFVDDLHLQFQGSGRVRELFKKIAKQLVHEGDLFGIVSSGPSSISQDMTYDRRRLEAAITKITGDGLKPNDIIQASSGAGGPSELRYRAHVAFSTMRDAFINLEKVHNRRKALVWVSEGYDFNPFQNSRLGLLDPSSPYLQNWANSTRNSMNAQIDPSGNSQRRGLDGFTENQQQNETFSDADLNYELGELTRMANRANTTIFTIDPRGLIAGNDIDEPVNPIEWNQYVRKSQDTMRTLAEETGGIAVVNQNDFDKALQRIDNETSDYYILGYYSSNPDPTHRRRKIEVKVNRQDVRVSHSRSEYVLKPPPAPQVPPKP
jgi:VWFA-related protein